MSESALNRSIFAAVVVMILLALAAVVNPLLRSPGDPPASRVPVVAVAPEPDNLLLARQAAVSAREAVVQAQALAYKAAALKAAQAAAAAPQPAPKPPPAPAPVVAPVAAVAPVAGTDYAASAFGACVRSRENGGSYAWGTGDGGGAYQFEVGTWYGNGAAPGTYDNADAAYQDAIFNLTVANRGDSPWRPYDGCYLGM